MNCAKCGQISDTGHFCGATQNAMGTWVPATNPELTGGELHPMPTSTVKSPRQFIHEGYEYRFVSACGLERRNTTYANSAWSRVEETELSYLSSAGLRVVADAMDARGVA